VERRLIFSATAISLGLDFFSNLSASRQRRAIEERRGDRKNTLPKPELNHNQLSRRLIR